MSGGRPGRRGELAALVVLGLLLWGGFAGAEGLFSLDRYQGLQADVEREIGAYEEARGSEEERRAAAGALAANMDLFHYLHAWMTSPDFPPEWYEAAAANREVLIRNVVDLSASLVRCDILDRVGNALEVLRLFEEERLEPVRAEAMAHLRECHVRGWRERLDDLRFDHEAAELSRASRSPTSAAFRQLTEQSEERGAELLRHIDAGFETDVIDDADATRALALGVQVAGVGRMIDLRRCDDARGRLAALTPRLGELEEEKAEDVRARTELCEAMATLRRLQEEREVLGASAAAAAEPEEQMRLVREELRVGARVVTQASALAEEQERPAIREELRRIARSERLLVAEQYALHGHCREAQEEMAEVGTPHPVREADAWQRADRVERRIAEQCWRERRPAWPLWVGGSGVALVGGGTGTALHARSQRGTFEDIQDQCRSLGCDAEDLTRRDDAARRFDRARIPAITLLSTGGAMIAAGALGLVLVQPERIELEGARTLD